MMELVGVEPTTPCLQGRCSPTELQPRSRAGRTLTGSRGIPERPLHRA